MKAIISSINYYQTLHIDYNAKCMRRPEHHTHTVCGPSPNCFLTVESTELSRSLIFHYLRRLKL